LETDIWPIFGIETIESKFPNGFNPEVMPCTTTGMDKAEALNFYIFPTISSGEFTISVPNLDNYQVEIFNLLGQQVHYQNYNSPQVILAINVKAGVYFVNVSAANQSMVQKKVIR